MYLEIDLTTVPPSVELREPDDFKAFKVVVQPAEHAYVPVGELERLAGERANDPQWSENLQKMLDFAGQHGWVREDGAVRAHVENAA